MRFTFMSKVLMCPMYVCSYSCECVCMCAYVCVFVNFNIYSILLFLLLLNLVSIFSIIICLTEFKSFLLDKIQKYTSTSLINSRGLMILCNFFTQKINQSKEQKQKNFKWTQKSKQKKNLWLTFCYGVSSFARSNHQGNDFWDIWASQMYGIVSRPSLFAIRHHKWRIVCFLDRINFVIL